MNMENIKLHNNNISDQTKMQVNLSRVAITSLMELHPVIGNVFVESLCQREAKNLNLKTRIKDLEYVMDPSPLWMISLEI